MTGTTESRERVLQALRRAHERGATGALDRGVPTSAVVADPELDLAPSTVSDHVCTLRDNGRVREVRELYDHGAGVGYAPAEAPAVEQATLDGGASA